MKADGSIIIDTRIDTKGIKQGTDKIQSMMSGVISTAKKVGAAIAAAFAVKQIVNFSRECIELGSSLDEVQNVVDVTFGDMAQEINRWSKEAVTQFGLSELAAKQYTSTIGAMFKSMGITGGAITEMSEKMAGLAGDIASFYNLDTDAAFAKIRSGIAGETEPLKQLGINLSEANLEEFRLAEGIAKSYREMTQQEKAMLRYNYLLKVTADAQGDFARTSDSWANQTRILRLQIQSLKADLGKGLINLLTPVLKVINSIIQGIAKMAAAFRAFTELITGNKAGITKTGTALDVSGVEDYAQAENDAADATEKSAKATEAANKANKKYTAGLDTIHQYQSETTSQDKSSGSTSKSTTPTTTASSPIDFGTLAQGDTVLDTTAQKMKALYDTIMKGAQPAIDALKKLYNEGLQKIGNFVWTAAKDFYHEFLVPVGKWVMGEGIPRFVNAFNDGMMKIDWDRINNGLKDVWKALAPFTVHVGEGLLWFWENVLVPFRTWVANEVIPRFLRTVATVIKTADAVIEAAKPGFIWFWENVLQPIASWVADKFLKAWDWINERLEAFSKWCKEHPKIIENVTVGILAFVAAIKAISIITTIVGLIKSIGFAISGLAGIIGGIVSVLGGPLTIAIAAVIAIGVLVIKNWDAVKAAAQKAWKAICDTVKRMCETIKKNFEAFINGIKNTATKGWNLIKNATSSVWKGITSTLSNVWSGIKSTASSVWNGITSTLSSAWGKIQSKSSSVFSSIRSSASSAWSNISSNASSAWETVKNKVTGVFSAIGSACATMKQKIQDGFVKAFQAVVKLIKTPINTVVKFINGIISGIVKGINAMIGALNALSFKIPSWVPGLGGKTFGLNIPKIKNYPQIPLLAEGAVIPPNAPFAAVLGDQKQGTNIETPESLLRKIVREESGRNGKYEFKAMLNRRVIFDEIIAEAKLRQQMTAANPFDLA